MIAGVLSLLGLLLMYDNVYGDLREGPDATSAIPFDGLLPIELAIPFFLAVTVPLLWRRVAPIAAVAAALAGLVPTARWHAPDVDVRVRFTDDALELAVSVRARRGARASFEQARERARLQRGTLETTTRGGRAVALVSLPVLAVT